MNHQNLLTENKQLKKQLKQKANELRDLRVKYDILADRKEKQDPRANAEEISQGAAKEHLGDMSLAQAEQMIKSFNQNYDEDVVKNLHGEKKIQYFYLNSQRNLLVDYVKELRTKK